MANQLDLEEQEQLDQLKHFWNQYGNKITWLIIIALACVASWNGYQWWQRSQSNQAAAMYDEVERVIRSGDVQKAERAFTDMRERFASTTYAHQAGLLLAKMAYDAGKPDVAKGALSWVAEKSNDKAYAATARLRLAGVLIDAKAYDDALKLLGAEFPLEFAALVADRKADIYQLQGKRVDAIALYQTAYAALDKEAQYRRLVEIKLNALGVDPSKAGATK
jgi:predicted negative regulator of RcsB-dependent stress response